MKLSLAMVSKHVFLYVCLPDYQSDIGMRLLRLDDEESTGLMQVDCEDILSAGLIKTVSATCIKSANMLHQVTDLQ